MATVTRLGQDGTIRERIGRLQEMHSVVNGQAADLAEQLEEKRANLARIEGGIIELQYLLTPPVEPEVKSDEEPEEE